MTSAETREKSTNGDRGDRDPILTLIALFKFAKAALLIALGLGALRLIRSDMREQARALFEALG
ncbi:MAG: hypothetical protein ACREK8_09595 [Gemmatimonadales bacterium]